MEIRALANLSNQPAAIHNVVSLQDLIENSLIHSIVSMNKYFSAIVVSLYIFLLDFIGDRYPKTYPCGAKYTCAHLKKKGKCKQNVLWKSAGLPSGCRKKLTNWEKNRKVRSFCRRTCGECKVGTQKLELRKGIVTLE